MIHATFEDGDTMLFDPDEIVTICTEIYSREYIAGDKSGSARVVVVPGVYVLMKEDDDGAIASETRIKSVRDV